MYQAKAVRRGPGPGALPLVAVNGGTENPASRVDQPHAVSETAGQGYGALNGFLSDLRELRESLAAIQTSLDRISDQDAPVIDVREDLKNAV
jgi:hypothetical protein